MDVPHWSHSLRQQGAADTAFLSMGSIWWFNLPVLPNVKYWGIGVPFYKKSLLWLDRGFELTIFQAPSRHCSNKGIHLYTIYIYIVCVYLLSYPFFVMRKIQKQGNTLLSLKTCFWQYRLYSNENKCLYTLKSSGAIFQKCFCCLNLSVIHL